MPISNLRIQWHWLLIFLMLCLSMSNTLAAAEASAEPGKSSTDTEKKADLRRISFEAYGQYTFQPQTTNATLSEYALGGNGQTQLNFVVPPMHGPAIGGRVESEFFPKVSCFIGVQYKSLVAKYQGYSTAVTGSPAATKIIANLSQDISYKYWIVDFGFRVRTPLLWGEVFAGLGGGLILPFQWSDVAIYTYESGFGTTAGSVKSSRTTKNFNLGLAGLVEIGYQYPLSQRLFFSISLHVIFGSVTNAGKTSETTTYYGNDTSSRTTKEYRKSYTLDEAANFSAASGNTASLAIYEALNITDIGIRGAISFRLY
ncbi:MAG: hypothetical protein JNJ69_00955 [Leptospiraceae bacterium]|nr:hypothetical protein [Leptospiraceae bacterium]